jgi:hypothetical protein
MIDTGRDWTKLDYVLRPCVEVGPVCRVMAGRGVEARVTIYASFSGYGQGRDVDAIIPGP